MSESERGMVFQFTWSAGTTAAEFLTAAGSWLEDRDAEAAKTLYEAGVGLQSSMALYRLGKLLLRLGSPEEALPRLAEHYRLLPDHLDGSRSLGKALLEAGRATEAVRHLEEAYQQWPQDASLQVLLLKAYYVAGDWQRAWALYTAARPLGNPAKLMAAVAAAKLKLVDAVLLADELPPNYRRALEKEILEVGT